jgi:hypothetical protein
MLYKNNIFMEKFMITFFKKLFGVKEAEPVVVPNPTIVVLAPIVENVVSPQVPAPVVVPEVVVIPEVVAAVPEVVVIPEVVAAVPEVVVVPEVVAVPVKKVSKPKKKVAVLETPAAEPVTKKTKKVKKV